MVLDYVKYKEKLLTDSDNISRQFFVKRGFVLEAAYSYLLDDNLSEAKKLFSLNKEIDVRAHWGLILISLIEGNIKDYPTYFQLRNFLEIDLNILIHYFKGDYVEKIIRYADYMFTINPEVHKFIGRVLYNNGLEEQAMFFLNRAKSYFYHDPELHYLLAYIYNNNNEIDKAKSSCKDCLRILPKYYPAEALMNNLIS